VNYVYANKKRITDNLFKQSVMLTSLLRIYSMLSMPSSFELGCVVAKLARIEISSIVHIYSAFPVYQVFLFC